MYKIAYKSIFRYIIVRSQVSQLTTILLINFGTIFHTGWLFFYNYSTSRDWCINPDFNNFTYNVGMSYLPVALYDIVSREIGKRYEDV